MESFLVEFLSWNIRDTNTSLKIQELVSSSLGVQVDAITLEPSIASVGERMYIQE